MSALFMHSRGKVKARIKTPHPILSSVPSLTLSLSIEVVTMGLKRLKDSGKIHFQFLLKFWPRFTSTFTMWDTGGGYFNVCTKGDASMRYTLRLD